MTVTKPALPASAATIKVDDKDVSADNEEGNVPYTGNELTVELTGVDTPGDLTYTWEANTGADGAYAAITEAADATNTFTIPDNLLGKQIKVTITAANYSGAASVTTAVIAEPTVPYAEGTITYDNPGDATKFVDFSKSAVSMNEAGTTNTTKSERIETNDKPAAAKYLPYPAIYSYKGDAVKISFDMTAGRGTHMSIVGTEPGTNDRDNDAAIRYVTFGNDTSDSQNLYVWHGGAAETATDTKEEITTAPIGGGQWYHVETVTNVTDKKVSVKVYKYKANNNYTKETPLYEVTDKTIRDTAMTGIVGLAYYGDNKTAGIDIDNICFSDEEFVAPAAVQATDAQVTPAFLTKTAEGKIQGEQSVTITPDTKAGKKVKKVLVNGTKEATKGDGTYTYQTDGTEEELNVTVEYTRADADDSITIDGPTMIKKGTTKDYKAIVKAGDYTFTDDDEVEVTWSLVDATQDQAATVQDGTAVTGTSLTGVLAAAAGETASKVRVKAEVEKDVEVPGTKVTGYATVEFVDEDVYKVTAVTPDNHGTVKLQVSESDVSYIKKSQELTIVVTPNEGYEVDKVSYKIGAEGSDTDVQNESGYKIPANTLTDDTVITVTFKATPYSVTNNGASGDGKGNSIAVDKTPTATVEDTVTITPTLNTGYILKSLTAKKNNTDSITLTPTADGKYTFKMVAAPVTIDAEYVKVKTVELDGEKVKAASVNFHTPTVNATPAADTCKVGQATISGNKLTGTKTSSDAEATAALINIDASAAEYTNKIYGMRLKLNAKCDDGKNTYLRRFGYFANYIDDLSQVNANNVNDQGGTPTTVVDTGNNWTYGNKTNEDTLMENINLDEFFVKDFKQLNTTGKITMYIGTGTAHLTTLSNIKVSLIVEDDAE